MRLRETIGIGYRAYREKSSESNARDGYFAHRIFEYMQFNGDGVIYVDSIRNAVTKLSEANWKK